MLRKSTRLVILILLSVLCNGRGSVQTTRLDPPFSMGAFQETDDDPFSIFSIDFNLDGISDFRFSYGAGGPGVACYFNYPNQIAILRAAPAFPDQTNVYGTMGALPLGTIIGSNLVSTIDLSDYTWHFGTTNHYDLTLAFGDHQTSVFGVIDPVTIGVPPLAAGDPVAKEGVMGFRFLIGTNVHFGYVHFDFRTNINRWYMGAGGYILGWAYETEADKPIVAAPISVSPTPFSMDVRAQENGAFDLTWKATPGATFQIEGTPSLSQPFTTFTPAFLSRPNFHANQVIEDVTIFGMANYPTYFWRVKRAGVSN
ncbi:MAG: hypothetical protein JWM04_596 [Verrucomicrobiales bacterium]|nr:hypothetical protein [Verrucomicrobiales bacterium]